MGGLIGLTTLLQDISYRTRGVLGLVRLVLTVLPQICDNRRASLIVFRLLSYETPLKDKTMVIHWLVPSV